MQTPAGAPLRRLPAPVFLVMLTSVWGLVILFALEAGRAWVLGRGLAIPDGPRLPRMAGAAMFAFGSALLLNFALRLRSLVGTRVLLNFLLGRYHRPVREERVFMFLDLAGSTAMAERLGDERTQELIARFFFDIAAPVLEHGGETHRYIGDEVVVTWPLSAARRDSRCLDCVLDISRLVARRAGAYEREFGERPRFRVGLHCGPVVASEVGDDKREVVYFGDTVNTAARIAAHTRVTGHDCLISGDVVAALPLPAGSVPEPVGEAALRGKRRPVTVYALELPG